MCTYWQSTFLCVISRDNDVPKGRWETFIQLKYVLSVKFLQKIISCSVFLPFFLFQRASATERVPCTQTSATYPVQRVIPDSTVLRI